ncbi:hypothetical protein KY289_008297 [Solanum tuberosum]|nr:hypothetical protein KY289_008297 [Solanum tuberosum]
MDISTLWGEVPLPDVLEIPSVVPSSTMPEDVEDETYEEELRAEEHGISETLAELHKTKKVILQAS